MTTTDLHRPGHPRRRPHQALRLVHGRRRRQLHRQTEPHLRSARPQRRRQDHDHAAAHRPGLRHPRRHPGVRREAGRERPDPPERLLHQREPALPRRLHAEARLPQRALVLRELGRRLRRAPHRRLPAAAEPPHQEALARPAVGRRRDRRPGLARTADVLRRAVPGAGCGGPAESSTTASSRTTPSIRAPSSSRRT